MLSAIRRLPSAARLSATRAVPVRAMTFEHGSRSIKEREAAIENQYFNKEEERTLKNLLKKLSRPTEPAAVKAEKDEIENIFKKHGVKASSSIIDDIYAWKHMHDEKH
eukprot:tig00020965_g16840.t1